MDAILIILIFVSFVILIVTSVEEEWKLSGISSSVLLVSIISLVFFYSLKPKITETDWISNKLDNQNITFDKPVRIIKRDFSYPWTVGKDKTEYFVFYYGEK